ncbi:MAG: hypothetical protein SGJ19_14230, partial [Planctomycetia bacterium]|nr:hypothetical protein [Planctomycetia bacterium]
MTATQFDYLTTLSRHPQLAKAALEWLIDLDLPGTEQAAPTAAKLLGGDAGMLVERQAGGWAGLYSTGLPAGFPNGLADEALDRERCCREDNWLAAPLHARGAHGELFLVRCGRPPAGAEIQEQMAAVARLLGEIVGQARRRSSERQRLERLRTIL